MERRVTEKYVTKYDKIILNQPLAHGKVLQQIYDKSDRGWVLSYNSDSVHHVCPFDGIFRDCKECGLLDDDFDTTYCTDKTQIISTAALIGRINDCLNADLKVDFLYKEDLFE